MSYYAYNFVTLTLGLNFCLLLGSKLFSLHIDFCSHCIKAAITFRMFSVIMGALVLHQHHSHNPREEHPSGYFCLRQ